MLPLRRRSLGQMLPLFFFRSPVWLFCGGQILLKSFLKIFLKTFLKTFL